MLLNLVIFITGTAAFLGFVVRFGADSRDGRDWAPAGTSPDLPINE